MGKDASKTPPSTCEAHCRTHTHTSIHARTHLAMAYKALPTQHRTTLDAATVQHTGELQQVHALVHGRGVARPSTEHFAGESSVVLVGHGGSDAFSDTGNTNSTHTHTHKHVVTKHDGCGTTSASHAATHRLAVWTATRCWWLAASSSRSRSATAASWRDADPSASCSASSVRCTMAWVLTPKTTPAVNKATPHAAITCTRTHHNIGLVLGGAVPPPRLKTMLHGVHGCCFQQVPHAASRGFSLADVRPPPLHEPPHTPF